MRTKQQLRHALTAAKYQRFSEIQTARVLLEVLLDIRTLLATDRRKRDLPAQLVKALESPVMPSQ